jgi:nitrogen regulatory protein PII
MENRYKLLVIIVDRNLQEQLETVLEKYQLLPKADALGQSFVRSELLGFTENSKVIDLLTVSAGQVGSIYASLEENLKISLRGVDIAFTVPLSSVSGFCGKLMQYNTIKSKEEGIETMTENFQYTHEMIVAIVTRGNAELVKKVAQKSGARGGTTVHGLGLGGQEAAKFLGISIQEEKDIVLIVVDKADRAAVMQTIVDACGIEQEARGICFSVPVDSAIGLR